MRSIVEMATARADAVAEAVVAAAAPAALAAPSAPAADLLGCRAALPLLLLFFLFPAAERATPALAERAAPALAAAKAAPAMVPPW
jgi:hypothetical protein